MKLGKILGIISIVIAAIYMVVSIICIKQAPEFPDEFYELSIKDREAAFEMEEEILENASSMYKIANNISVFLFWGGIVTAIVSIVMIIKNKEKGIALPIISICVIIIMGFVSTFTIVDFGKAFEAGYNSAAEEIHGSQNDDDE